LLLLLLLLCFSLLSFLLHRFDNLHEFLVRSIRIDQLVDPLHLPPLFVPGQVLDLDAPLVAGLADDGWRGLPRHDPLDSKGDEGRKAALAGRDGDVGRAILRGLLRSAGFPERVDLGVYIARAVVVVE